MAGGQDMDDVVSIIVDGFGRAQAAWHARVLKSYAKHAEWTMPGLDESADTTAPVAPTRDRNGVPADASAPGECNAVNARDPYGEAEARSLSEHGVAVEPGSDFVGPNSDAEGVTPSTLCPQTRTCGHGCSRWRRSSLLSPTSAPA